MSERVTVAFPFSDAGRVPEIRSRERKCAELMIASVRRHMPDVEIWQLTDEDVTEELPVDLVSRKDFNHRDWVPWMYEHLAAVPGNVLFLDSDVIVQRDLRPMFMVDADVIVTSRGPKVMDGRQMPFLLGVLASKVPEFWLAMRDRVLAMPDEIDRGWWGSQLSIFDEWMDQQMGRSRWNIQALHCDPHNYVPKDAQDAPTDKWVLHYKGKKRKPWMLERWAQVFEVKEAA